MILVCGEALIDIFVGEETHDHIGMDGRFGGSPFNVAFGLARMGQKAEFLTGLSNDLIGRRLYRFLREEGVGERFLRRSNRPSTLSIVDLSVKSAPLYAFYGEGAADRDIRFGDIAPLPDTIRALHFGSFSTVVEPVGAALEALAKRESGARLIAYDPNIRPTIEADMAVWRRKVETMAGYAHVLKISDEDFDLLYGDADHAAIARAWLAQNVRLVVLTRGGKGVEAWSRTHHLNLAASEIKLVDSVGAGDTFQAGLLTALAETGNLSGVALDAISLSALTACLNFAAGAAAITCSRRGADIPRRHELPAKIV